MFQYVKCAILDAYGRSWKLKSKQAGGASLVIYKKFYILKGEKIEEITRRVNEPYAEHAILEEGENEMAKIIYHEDTKIFHLQNKKISYIMSILENGHLGQLYYGRRIHDKPDFSYLVEKAPRPMVSYIYEWDRTFSLEHIKQEYPVYGTTDYRHPAVEILQENGSRISEFVYESHEIRCGKPCLEGLPATYTECDDEAQTLCVVLKDSLTKVQLELLYTIFEQDGVIARSACFANEGDVPVHLLNAMSLSLDLPDKDYVWMQLSGSWSRERHVKSRVLEQGIQAIDSRRGNSSHEHNPFLVLKRPDTTEHSGEAIGFSLVYSGNFLMQQR